MPYVAGLGRLIACDLIGMGGSGGADVPPEKQPTFQGASAPPVVAT